MTMLIYSKKIIKFVERIKLSIKEILAKEIGLKVYGNRFFNYFQDTSYPISVVIYNNKRMLGYFDSSFYELGFHENLMQVSKDQLNNIIRHELAHYIIFTQQGNLPQPHSSEFRAFCIQRGWGEEVYKATFDLENKIDGIVEDNNGILRKIQKLMALSASNNENEAELAMIKSQQLLLKHNIESSAISDLSEEKMHLLRIMKQKRENAKMRAIAKILETFFVNIVYSRHGDYTYLEILGSLQNVEIAEYVAGVLNLELEKLWVQAQKNNQLKGKVAKNSFFLGIAKGYCNKINSLKMDYNTDVKNALIVINEQLKEAADIVYERLSRTSSSRTVCQTSSLLGELMGKNLQIKPAVNMTNPMRALIDLH